MAEENNSKPVILHRATEFSVWNKDKKKQEESNIELVVIKENDRKEKGENGETKYLSYGVKFKDGEWINGFMNEVSFDDNPELKLLSPKPKEDEIDFAVGYEEKTNKDNKSYRRIYVKTEDGVYHSSFVNNK